MRSGQMNGHRTASRIFCIPSHRSRESYFSSTSLRRRIPRPLRTKNTLVVRSFFYESGIKNIIFLPMFEETVCLTTPPDTPSPPYFHWNSETGVHFILRFPLENSVYTKILKKVHHHIVTLYFNLLIFRNWNLNIKELVGE